MNYEYTRGQLRQLMLTSGLTQQTFAKKCGLSQSAVARFLSGQRRPQLETLVKVCRAFQLDMRYFVAELQNISLPLEGRHGLEVHTLPR